MGAFDQVDATITIHSDKWDAHEMVTAREVATVADEEWVNNRVLKMKQDKKNKKGLDFQSELGATRRLWLERMIVSWTLTQNGQPVPVSSAAIAKLPSKYADVIYEAINAANEDEDEEEDDNFLQDASTPTEEAEDLPQPVEMKAKRNYLSK